MGFFFFFLDLTATIHPPFTQASVVSESLLAPCVFSRQKGATSQVTYALLAGFIASKHGKWQWFLCGSNCWGDFGYSYIRVHQGPLLSKGSLLSNLLKKHAIVTLLGCPSSEAAANLTSRKIKISVPLFVYQQSLKVKILFSIIFGSLAFIPSRILLSYNLTLQIRA